MAEKDHEYIKLTPVRKKALRDERKRTQTGSHKLLKNIYPKYGLIPGTIEHWFYGARSARKDQYEYVLELYAALPSYVELTPLRQGAIKSEIERTAVGIHALFNKIEECQPGLNAKIIANWLTHTKFAKEAHYEYVLSRYKSLPSNIDCDALSSPADLNPDDPDFRWLKRNKKLDQRGLNSPERVKRPTRISITDEMRELLNSEIERTGACLQTLVRLRPKPANKLKGPKISFWRYGRTKKANALEWEYVISALASLPDKPG